MSPRLVSALAKPWLAAWRYKSTALMSLRGIGSSPCAYLTANWFCAAGSPRLAATTMSASGPGSVAGSSDGVVSTGVLAIGAGADAGAAAVVGVVEDAGAVGACGVCGATAAGGTGV